MSAYAGEFKSGRQFKLSGRRKSGYDFKFKRAVAQSGSALPWGGRGPGFKSRRPDNLKTGGRGQVEGGKTVSRSTRSTFNLSPSTEAKRWHEVPPADGVREVGD